MGKKLTKTVQLLIVVAVLAIFIPVICKFVKSLQNPLERAMESGGEVAQEVAQTVAQGAADATLSARLGAAGWIFFGSDGCGWCQKQKEELGPGFEVVYVETSTELAEKLIEQHNVEIDGVPHWFNVNSRAEMGGMQPREELEKIV